MKFQITKTVNPSRTYRPITYKAEPVKDDEWCCPDMKDAWEEEFIGFGEYEGYDPSTPDINIYHCNPYPEGPVWYSKGINFCPFCAQKIEKVISEVQQ